MRNINWALLAGATLIGLLSALQSCKSPEVVLNTSLNAKEMPVKGRNGFLIGQKLQYGHYSTDKVKRGWVQGYDVPFFVRFQGAKEKIHFTQYGPNAQKAQVNCVSKFKNVEIPIVLDFFSIPLQYKNFFVGNIATQNSHWDFILYNPNGDLMREKESGGFAQSGQQKIQITALRALKGQPQWMSALAVYGYEFVVQGKVVGAVSMVNRGTVWIEEQLDAETRTVIAALASGILLRTDVESVEMRQTR